MIKLIINIFSNFKYCKLLLVVTFLTQFHFANAANLTVTANTLWSVLNPGAADIITVKNGATLTVDVGGGVCTSITLGSGGGSAGNGTLTFNNGSQITVSGLVTLGNGTQNGSINMSAGGTLICSNIVHNSAISFNTSSGTIEIRGAGVTLPSNVLYSSFNNLRINSTTTVLISQNIIVNNTLTLTSGILDLGNFNLTLGTTGTISGAFSSTKMIQTSGTGSLIKQFTSAPASFTFPIGTGSVYTNFNISSFTATVSGTGSIKIRTIASKEPNLIVCTDYLSKYWEITSSNISNINANLDFFYANSEITGTETNFTGILYNSGWDQTGTVDVVNNKISFVKTGATDLSGNWTCANTNCVPVVYYSRANGSWEDANTWSTISHVSAIPAATPPPAASNIDIGGGFTVTKSTSAALSVTSINIDSDGTLDLNGQTGLSIGTLNGTGKLKLVSNSSTTPILPTITTNNLKPSGTYEFGGSGNYSLSNASPFYNLIISGGGIKSLPAATTVNNTLTLSNGVLELSIFDLTLGVSASFAAGTYDGTHMIQTSSTGKVIKQFTTTTLSNFNFPIGTIGGMYSRSNIDITSSSVSGTASIGIRTTATQHPNCLAPGNVNSLGKYWVITSNNISGINATIDFYYNDVEIPATETGWVDGYYPSGGPWTYNSGSVTAASNKISCIKTAASTLSGDYSAGPTDAFFSPTTTFYSRTNTNWGTATTWSNNGCGGTAAATSPTAASNVIICTGNTVTLNANTQIQNLTVQDGGVLDLNNKDLTVTGNLTLNGTLIGTSGGTIIFNTAGSTVGGTGSLNCSNPNTYIYFQADGSILSSADLTLFTAHTGNPVIRILNNATVTNYGTITANMDITGDGANSIFINEAGANLRIGGVLLATGQLTANATGNTIDYTSANAQNVKVPTDSYFNLTVSGIGTKTLTSSVTILGNLTINSTTLTCTAVPYNITLKGDWNNSGTFIENTGNVIIDGSNNQTLSCPGGETFYNLETNKSNGTFILNNNVTISNILTMTMGNINTGSNRISLTNTSSTALSWLPGGGSVIGEFERWLNATTVFDVTYPVGTAYYERQLVQSFSNNTAGSVIAKFVSVNPGLLSPRPTADGATNVYNTFNEGYWSLTAANGLSSSLYNLAASGNGFTSFTINSSTRLMTRPNAASAWTANGTHLNAVGFTAKRTGVSTFSAQYCLADITACNGPSTSAITGTSSVCINATPISYSVTNTSGSTYAWTVSEGSISSGQGTNNVNITWGSTGSSSGSVTVVETNTCTSGDPVNYTVEINPVPVTSITGKISLPINSSGEVYSVTPLAGYTYSWTITGGFITSPAGPPYNGNSVTVTWNSTPGYGTISVTASDGGGCGTSAPFVLNVYKYIVINSVQSGSWESTTTWDCGCVPLSTDNVRIRNPHVVTLPANESAYHVIIDAGGTLDASTNNKNFFVNGDFTVNGIFSGGTKVLYLNGVDTYIDGTGDGTSTGLISCAANIEIGGGNKIIPGSATLKFDIGVNSLLFNTGGFQISNNGNITVVGNIAGTAANNKWVNEANSNLKIDKALLTTGTLYANSQGNIIEYNGAAQSIKTPLTTYYNLTCSGSGTKTAGANLDLDGTLTISGTAQLAIGTNNLNIGGNWINSSVNADPFIQGTGTQSVTFDGSTDQTLSCSTAGGEIFNNLIVNKNGVLILSNSDISITKALTMSSGNINPNSYIVVLGTALPFEAALNYTSGIITGKLKYFMTTTGTKLFPIGTSTYYRPITITTTGITSGSLTGEFISADPGAPPALSENGINIIDRFTEGYWSFTSANGFSTTANYSIEATGTGFVSQTINSSTRILKRLGAGSWALEGTHANAAAPTCYRNSLTTLAVNSTYNFCFGHTDCSTFSPATITGNTDVCMNSFEAYSIPNVAGHTYSWTITNGQNDPNPFSGQNTNSITVNWQNAWSITASVSVIESSTCYSAPAVTKLINIHTLPTSVITGPATVSENTTQGLYSVTSRPGYTYTWSVPVGNGSISSGQGTNSVMVNWGSASAATLRVIAQYGTCSAATNQDYSVTIYSAPFSIGGGGSWSNPAIWSCNCIPSTSLAVPNNNAKISAGSPVTLDVPITINHLNIELGATLSHNATQGLINTGDYSNNGTHNLNTSGTLTFSTGAGTINGSGQITNIGTTINVNINRDIGSLTNLTFNFTGGTGKINLASGVIITNYGIITLSGGPLEAANNTSIWINDVNSKLKINGALFQAGGGKGTLTAAAAGNTVEYYGTQTVKTPSSSIYHHLTISGTGVVTQAAALTLNGNFSINGTSQYTVTASNYQLNVGGNWTVLSTNANPFVENSGTIVLNGSSNQTITTALAAGETFYNLQIVKTLGGNILLGGTTSITVSNLLTLTKGKIITGTNKVYIPAGGSTNGGDNDSYVEGWVRKTGNTAFIFPTGDGTKWSRIGISAPATITKYFEAKYHNSVYIDLTASGTLDHVSSLDYFDLIRDPSSTDQVRVSLYWEDASIWHVDDCNDLTIGHWNGTSWEEVVATATGTCSGTGSGSATTNAVVTSYSPFAFGSRTTKNPLPVSMMQFTANCENGFVTCEWSTLTEINNDFFDLQKSFNTENWEHVATIKGAGNSNSVQQYKFIDKSAETGTIYYKLVQHDYDGKETTYRTIATTCEPNNDYSNIIIYPNPANNLINLLLSSSIEDKGVMYIYNDIGNCLFSKEISINSETNKISVDISKFSIGSYYIKLIFNHLNPSTHQFVHVSK